MIPQLKFNLVIVQPSGYVHSLVFLDTARYFRHQLRGLGHEALISKNRVRADCLNIVFGAHLGFPAEWCHRHAVVFVNLEQLGPGGAAVSDSYRRLLASHPVIDYREQNITFYRTPGSAAAPVPLVEFHCAPYLRPIAPTALCDRPLDLLFIGSMNDRRRAVLSRIEGTGLDVAVFDQPMYGPERDDFVGQAKAVINIPFYDAGVFEQVRAFGVLSLGTPVISLRPRSVPSAHENAVCWVDDGDLDAYFRDHFKTPAWYDHAEAALASWQAQDGAANFAPIAQFCRQTWQDFAGRSNIAPWLPTRLNLGSGKDYVPGWLNIDILERAEPDVVLDLSKSLDLPLIRIGRDGTPIHLREESLELVYANNVLEHVEDLPTLMTNALRLLRTGGTFLIEVPYERAQTAWQDPTHVRAMNENSWIYYTDWFWYLGWFEHRFKLNHFTWLDARVSECEQAQAAFMRVELVKMETTPQERVRARTLRADFGAIPDDRVAA